MAPDHMINAGYLGVLGMERVEDFNAENGDVGVVDTLSRPKKDVLRK